MKSNEIHLETATLEQLQAAYLVGWVPEDISDQLEHLREIHGDGSILETIQANYPQFVTGAGKAALGMGDERKPEIILEGIQERSPDEKPATKRQLGFFRMHFRIDETALAALGEWQAHAAMKLVLETFANRPENQPSTPFELNEMQLLQFLFRTRPESPLDSKYGIWAAMGDMPFVLGGFGKARFLGTLAMYLLDLKRIVYVAKDGQLVEGAERAALISEAAEIAADYYLDRGPLAQPPK